jgi:hypothetical protein
VSLTQKVLVASLSLVVGASAKALAASQPLMKNRVVLIVSGHASFEKHPVRLASLEEHVVHALDSDSDTEVIGVVLCFTSHGAEALSNATRAGTTNLTDVRDRVVVVVNDAYVEQYERLDACFRHGEAARKRRGWGAVTHYLRLRPDTIFVKRVTPLSLLRAGFVSGRVRAVLYPKSTLVPRAKLSAFWLKCAKRANHETRVAILNAKIPFCALVDEIFNVVPSIFAKAFFHLEPNYPNEPEPGASVWSDSPLRTHPSAVYQAAVWETYGAADNSDVYRETCHPDAKNNRTYGHGHSSLHNRGFSAEERMTWRLMMRLVPYTIEPFWLSLSEATLPHLQDEPCKG